MMLSLPSFQSKLMVLTSATLVQTESDSMTLGRDRGFLRSWERSTRGSQRLDSSRLSTVCRVVLVLKTCMRMTKRKLDAGSKMMLNNDGRLSEAVVALKFIDRWHMEYQG